MGSTAALPGSSAFSRSARRSASVDLPAAGGPAIAVMLRACCAARTHNRGQAIKIQRGRHPNSFAASIETTHARRLKVASVRANCRFRWATDGAGIIVECCRRASANARRREWEECLVETGRQDRHRHGCGTRESARRIARKFAAEGARVIVAERDRKTGAAVAASLPGARFIHTDVAKEDSIVAMVAETVETVGPPDILINNAGIAVFDEPLKLSAEEWHRCFSVDLDGVWYCCKHVLPHLLDKGAGAIVNIASVHAFQIIPHTFPYPVAKHGVLGLTRALAIEYAPRGIRINAISPGYIDTPVNEWYFSTLPDPAGARRAAEALHPVKRMGPLRRGRRRRHAACLRRGDVHDRHQHRHRRRHLHPLPRRVRREARRTAQILGKPRPRGPLVGRSGQAMSALFSAPKERVRAGRTIF